MQVNFNRTKTTIPFCKTQEYFCFFLVHKVLLNEILNDLFLSIMYVASLSSNQNKVVFFRDFELEIQTRTVKL